MAATSQVLLLADHIKLSLLERQRAVSLDLEPTGHDGEISRSLDSMKTALEELEASAASSPDTALTASRARAQYNDLYAQFHGRAPPTPLTATPNDPALGADFASARTGTRVKASALKRSTSSGGSKSVRFRDDPAVQEADAEHEAIRAALLPYRDDPDDAAPDHSRLDNQQIHEYHSQVMRDQDAQLDRLGESVGRTRHLSIQIGNELDEQGEMLDDVDGRVDRHITTLDRAKGRLGKIARKAKDNMQLTVIFVLIIILVLLIVILE